jgi:hypothetical protein
MAKLNSSQAHIAKHLLEATIGVHSERVANMLHVSGRKQPHKDFDGIEASPKNLSFKGAKRVIKYLFESNVITDGDVTGVKRDLNEKIAFVQTKQHTPDIACVVIATGLIPNDKTRAQERVDLTINSSALDIGSLKRFFLSTVDEFPTLPLIDKIERLSDAKHADRLMQVFERANAIKSVSSQDAALKNGMAKLREYRTQVLSAVADIRGAIMADGAPLLVNAGPDVAAGLVKHVTGFDMKFSQKKAAAATAAPG